MESIRRELKIWAATPAKVPAEDTRNPFDGTNATPQINNDDLRQLVLRLIERVERLEQKVTVLERRRS